MCGAWSPTHEYEYCVAIVTIHEVGEYYVSITIFTL